MSKNQLTELPEYFGQLKNLRHLDLYNNKIQRLPVSFAQLKSLKWLDLKNNPLVPALRQAAGNCITATDCAMCAKKVVALLQSMQSQLERERQKNIMEEQRLQAAQRQAEEAERDRLKAEKRAAKERRRKEDAAKAARETGGNGSNSNEAYTRHEMERPRDSKSSNGSAAGADTKTKGGWCWSLFMFLMGLTFIGVATGISLLWIYTGGRLDQRNIERAIPVIRRDVDLTLATVGKQAEGYYKDSCKVLTCIACFGFA